MADDVIERVARAIVTSRHGGYVDIEDGHFWWGLWVDEAKAAIAAMREPTQAMWMAGDEMIGDDAEPIWRAMIDAALGASETADSESAP